MIIFFDSEYKATKRIKQGRAKLEPPFAELAEWIASTWRVTVLSVIYDQIVVGKARPRLQVIVEHSRERQEFFDGPNYDRSKQEAIAGRFTELIDRSAPAAYRVDGLLVAFLAFAPMAREDADDRIGMLEMRALRARIATPDLWKIHRILGHVTFMFYTEEQRLTLQQMGFRETYADMYFEVLRKHDEFGYLDRARFSVEFDSKENFDQNYGGSWFNYDRR